MVLISALSSCGFNHAYVLNQNQNNTQVQLSEKNFEVVGQAEGTAEVEYVLIFGGLKKRALFNDAYSQMVENAQLNSSSRALTNILTEEQISGFPPFYYKRTLSVKSNVIEFTK